MRDLSFQIEGAKSKREYSSGRIIKFTHRLYIRGVHFVHFRNELGRFVQASLEKRLLSQIFQLRGIILRAV